MRELTESPGEKQALGVANPVLPGFQPIPRETSVRPVDSLFEAVADLTVSGWRQGLTGSARGCLNRAVAELRGIDVTAGEVAVLVAAYQADMPGCTLTPTALAKHAPRLRGAQQYRYPAGHDAILRAL